MINRRVFLLTSLGALVSAPSAFAAATPEDLVARDLVGSGFRITSRRRTLLGRVRFVAVRGETEREVVLDPSSGEILRDYSRDYGRGEGSESSGRGTSSSGEPSGGDGEGEGEGENQSSGEGEREPSGGGETPSTESPSEPTREREEKKTTEVPR
jgi:hypothetical protein